MAFNPLGKPTFFHIYGHDSNQFGGGCVYLLQRHFVDCLLNDKPFESNGRDYLKTLHLVEAVYNSANIGQVISLK